MGSEMCIRDRLCILCLKHRINTNISCVKLNSEDISFKTFFSKKVLVSKTFDNIHACRSRHSVGTSIGVTSVHQCGSRSHQLNNVVETDFLNINVSTKD